MSTAWFVTNSMSFRMDPCWRYQRQIRETHRCISKRCRNMNPHISGKNISNLKHDLWFFFSVSNIHMHISGWRFSCLLNTRVSKWEDCVSQCTFLCMGSRFRNRCSLNFVYSCSLLCAQGSCVCSLSTLWV